MAYKIPLARPYINKEAIDKVAEVLRTGYLTEGPVTKEFEEAIAKYVNVKYAISFTSNTTGMETVLRAIGVGKGDEVIVPNYTYPATASVVYIVGADPVLVDVDPETANIDYSKIEKAITEKTKAILPVSLFGNPLDYDELNRIKEKHNLYIIEDAACSIGSGYNNTMTGSLADASVFSFHPRKFITTGEGGIVTTNDPRIAEFCKSYKNFGMKTKIEDGKLVTDSSTFNIIGTNYKLSNIQSALGLSQMKIIDRLLEERRSLAKRYDESLKNMNGVIILKTTKKGNHSYQSYCIIIEDRDKIMVEMRKKGIEVQIGSIVLDEHQAFKDTRNLGDLKNSRMLGKRCMALPLYNGMTEEEQDIVVQELKSLLVQ